jgi:hypothetical protein
MSHLPHLQQATPRALMSGFVCVAQICALSSLARPFLGCLGNDALVWCHACRLGFGQIFFGGG